MMKAISPALSALRALGKKEEVTTNNIANVNTDGFKRSRADFQETLPGGVTVSINRIDTPGATLPSEDGTNRSRESSNVVVEEELVDLITTKSAYTANLKSIKTEEEMLGTLFDIIE